MSQKTKVGLDIWYAVMIDSRWSNDWNECEKDGKNEKDKSGRMNEAFNEESDEAEDDDDVNASNE